MTTTRTMRLVVVAGGLGVGADAAWAETATAVSAGRSSSYTCALTSSGGVVCWGWNYYGQLGDGTTTNGPSPTAVSGLSSGVLAITTGANHTCALLTGGAAWRWGGNSGGALGTGARLIGVAPLAVYGLGGALAAATVTPNHGPIEGGTVVTITGAYFLQRATVTIGGVAATIVSVISTTEILAVTGPHASGHVDVVVTNPDAQQGALSGGFTYGDVGAPFGDFTGDLKSEILWRHATGGDVWLWPMNGAARVSETCVRTVADTHWEIRGLGDQTGDGTADSFWRNKTTGQIYFWPMSGSTPVDEIYVATVDPAYDIVGTGDFNGDHKSDILWRNAAAGDVWVWLMNGTTRLSQTLIATVPDAGYQIQQLADFTGDGKADIVWWHATLGEVWMWTMNGPARVAETWVATVPDVHYQIVGAGDYDGNLKADLLWWNTLNGEVWMWLMDGPVRLSEHYIATVPDTGYQVGKGK